MHTISRFSRIAGLTLASVFTAALLLSCEEKEPVPVTINSQPSQIAAEGGSTSFTVTAPGTWTAAVQPASDGTAAAWLTIDPASGEAGEHTITITAEANTAEEERTATVIVTSGSSSATVSVSQAGATAQDEPEEPEEPDTPDHTGLVKSVEFSHSEGEYSWAYLFNFEYDDLNRVSIVQVWVMEGGEYSVDYSNKFTYNEDGTAILERDLYAVYGEGLEILNIVFDSEGKATEMFSAETSTYPDKTSYDMSYNDQGQLIAIKDNIYQSSEMSNIFEWSNGDNVKLIWSDDDVISDDDVTNVPFSAYDNNLKTNIDINWLSSIKSIVYIHQPHQILGAVGMLGKRDAHYAIPYAGGNSYNSPDEITLPEQIYYDGNPEPGDDGYVIYTHTVEYYLPDECITTFDIDSDGLLHSIKYEMPLHEMAITCKCRIGTEEWEQFLIPENELGRKDTVTGNSAISSVTVTYY